MDLQKLCSDFLEAEIKAVSSGLDEDAFLAEKCWNEVSGFVVNKQMARSLALGTAVKKYLKV